ncbi:hypothetical protein KPSA3_00096 [Pseudomonas syringae pv. actinidiae]|uniref:Uncharacterized protein n=1 Tax=Pseudomonas syringae pv. actinidiae TaxID=103796 RepID=A0AAN4PZK3_PSESF|nr:hypothetical protein KPSA3_00096 [Pseudomonas syringae pv. actinidiae]
MRRSGSHAVLDALRPVLIALRSVSRFPSSAPRRYHRRIL